MKRKRCHKHVQTKTVAVNTAGCQKYNRDNNEKINNKIRWVAARSFSVRLCRFQWQRLRLSYHAILWWSISSDLFFKGQMYTFFPLLDGAIADCKRSFTISGTIKKKTVTNWSNSADVYCMTDSVGNKQLEGRTYCLNRLFSFVWQSDLKP